MLCSFLGLTASAVFITWSNSQCCVHSALLDRPHSVTTSSTSCLFLCFTTHIVFVHPWFHSQTQAMDISGWFVQSSKSFVGPPRLHRIHSDCPDSSFSWQLITHHYKLGQHWSRERERLGGGSGGGEWLTDWLTDWTLSLRIEVKARTPVGPPVLNTNHKHSNSRENMKLDNIRMTKTSNHNEMERKLHKICFLQGTVIMKAI